MTRGEAIANWDAMRAEQRPREEAWKKLHALEEKFNKRYLPLCISFQEYCELSELLAITSPIPSCLYVITWRDHEVQIIHEGAD